MDWKIYRTQNHDEPVIGVDEVGRGCLAGPVFAAAVVLLSDVEGLTDSKLLSEKQREHWAERISSQHLVSIAQASVEEIDELNILEASFLAMQRAILALGFTRGHVLVDGPFPIRNLNQSDPIKKLNFKQTPFIKGDLRLAPISAAAICAKVARDHYMVKLAEELKGYGIEKHKGYSTLEHKTAIAKMGPTPWHRKSFRGVKEFVS